MLVPIVALVGGLVIGGLLGVIIDYVLLATRNLSDIPWPDETSAGDWLYSGGNLTSQTLLKTRGAIRVKQEPTSLTMYLDSIQSSGDVHVEGVVFEVRESVF